MSHITQEQRYTISVMKEQGYSQKDIAKVIKKDKSTLSRELRRNCDQRSGKYTSDLAQRKYNQRQKAKPRVIKFTDDVKKYVDTKLEQKWSPEQISKTPVSNGLTMVSHERIYQYIIEDKKKGGDKYKHLRRKKKYKRRCVVEDRRGKLANTKSIHERPQEADRRSRYGDYEVDLIVGANHKGGLLTMNDRKTGKVKIRKIEGKNSKHIAKLIVGALRGEKGRIHTITSDNGREFADHDYVSKKLGISFYFADPYSSWQRGSNENINGLIRQYFPKKTNFDTVSKQEVKRIENQLNKRPRKRFEFRSPIEEFNLLTKVAFAA
ncbi:IS30 family transposase [soil metagenome]